MKHLILAAAILSTSLPVTAGLYKCESPDDKPKLITEAPKKISFTTSKPYFRSYSQQPSISEGKTPFLIYYAIDTAEPFMQYSVRYELAELRLACEKSENVNYAAIVNSKFETWYTIQICKNKEFREIDIRRDFPTLHKSLEEKKNYIWDGDHTKTEAGPMSFLVRFHKENNKVFYEYPLAHPDFVHDLISFVITEESLFPKDKYMPFLNLKSHGSKKHVLSGLHPCQVDAKTQSQKLIIDKALNDTEKFVLNQPSYYQMIDHAKEALDKLALGSKIAAHDPALGEYSLGEYSLGEYSLGEYSLGDVMAGLGANGLGTKFSFGMYHTALSSVLYKLFNNEKYNFLGFTMLESCDTNRNIDFHHAKQDLVLGIYSAQNSLWYRNLNWWTLMEKADGSSLELIKLLETHTAKIPNIVVTD